MPWNYSIKEAWTPVARKIHNVTYYGIITELTQYPSVFVKIDWVKNQFKKPELIVDEEYDGIIVK
ncbi:MAG: hypothetical protein WCL51_11410 [Bacteroidota bacterium]